MSADARSSAVRGRRTSRGRSTEMWTDGPLPQTTRAGRGPSFGDGGVDVRTRMSVTMAVLVAALASASSASAATFQVTGTADNTGLCDGTTCTSIRQALASAAASAGPDTIVVP